MLISQPTRPLLLPNLAFFSLFPFPLWLRELDGKGKEGPGRPGRGGPCLPTVCGLGRVMCLGGGGDQELWVGPGTRERRGSDQLLCGCEGVLLAAGTNVLGSWVGTGGLL